MGTEFTGGLMGMNILESTRMACNGETEYSKRMENYLEKYTKKAS
jgi:hypothetical protein